MLNIVACPDLSGKSRFLSGKKLIFIFSVFTILFIFNSSFLIHNCMSQVWSPLGSGMNGFVMALTVYNNELIAGGYFTTAGGVSANYIAKWNGTTWSPLGNGLGGGSNTVVGALIIYNNELIACGKFTTTGGVSANNIAKWNGTTWSPLGSGTNNEVDALTVYNSELIAAGYFTIAGGDSAKRIAKWNGTTWSPLGSGMSSLVWALSVYNNELIVGGDFTTAGGVSAVRIAKWNGTIWSPLGSGMSSSVRAFTIYPPQTGELIAGGGFSTAGGVTVNNIAKWNGTTWSPLGSGMGGFNKLVLGLIVYPLQAGELIVGGYFTTAGGVSVNNVAKWNGTTWSPLGDGVNDRVRPFTIYNNELIVGGLFTSAGGVSANYIAKWGTATEVKIINQSIPGKFELMQNYPNPFNSVTSIKFQVTRVGDRSQKTEVRLKVFDMLGKEVAVLVNEKLQPGTYEVSFDAGNLSSGVYFYKLTAGDFTDTKRMILIK